MHKIDAEKKKRVVGQKPREGEGRHSSNHTGSGKKVIDELMNELKESRRNQEEELSSGVAGRAHLSNWLQGTEKEKA